MLFRSISDSVSGEILEAESFLYVDKNSQIAESNSELNSDIASIAFRGALKINVERAIASKEFNKIESCQRLTILFNRELITTITLQGLANSGK